MAVNPPQPRGTIQSERPSNDVRIEVGDESQTFETRFIAYEPGYNEYTNAPTTVYEHGLLYDQFDGASVTVEEPSLFNGDRFVMPILTGNPERTDTGTVSVSVHHMDGPRTRDVSGETVSITLPTAAADR